MFVYIGLYLYFCVFDNCVESQMICWGKRSGGFDQIIEPTKGNIYKDNLYIYKRKLELGNSPKNKDRNIQRVYSIIQNYRSRFLKNI